MEFAHTPNEMAKKLMEFNRDFMDDQESIKTETEYVTELFDKLHKSEEFEVLVAYLDLMFMDSAFNLGDE